MKWIVQTFCNHKMAADTQIKVIQCEKCKKKWWYEVKDLTNQTFSIKF